MQHEEVSQAVEMFARALIEAGGADPDTTVQPGMPTMFGTPHGQAVKVNVDTLVPLWRLYIRAATMGLEIARTKFEPSMGNGSQIEYMRPVNVPGANGAVPLVPGSVDQAVGL